MTSQIQMWVLFYDVFHLFSELGISEFLVGRSNKKTVRGWNSNPESQRNLSYPDNKVNTKLV